MKRIRIAFLSILAVLTALGFIADVPLWRGFEFFAVRSSAVDLTGVLGMGVMSIGMMLALRPVLLEPWLGGLDKIYRLHKWLGITGLVISVVHWLWAQGPKWAVGWGWLARPARRVPVEPASAWEAFARSQRGLAEAVGEWAFYALVVLVVLALIKRFPYRHFFKTHRLLAVVYLFLVFHSVVLTKSAYWTSAIGPVMAILMAGGTAAAFISLFRRVGHRRRAVGVIEKLEYHQANRVLAVTVRLLDRWSGHKAGQFAFLTFDRDEGPHPFTISSAWRGDGRVSFHIKEMGDYTRTLPDRLRIGALATVEGPYGCFNFTTDKPRQIWVAGGIGITPFLARLQDLAGSGNRQVIDFFFSTNAPDTGFLERVRQLSERAGVRLHALVTRKDGYLDAARLCDAVPEWKDADVWFCGPTGFGKTLRRDLIARGLDEGDFHQELFSMR
ncbi:MAG: ferric reductase-like transmembrane domain-containing protein [Thiohalomonadaceae bacterium]